jgi:hypothetical protein
MTSSVQDKTHKQILAAIRADPLFERAKQEETDGDTWAAFVTLSELMVAQKAKLARFPRLDDRLSKLAAAHASTPEPRHLDYYEKTGQYCLHTKEDEPLVYTIDNFISAEDCSNLIAETRWRMQRAHVVGVKKGVVTKGRTGSNCWMRHYESQTTFFIAQRISALLKVPLAHAEGLQCLYYDQKQEYRRHYDSYEVDGSEKSKRCLGNGGQRIYTGLGHCLHHKF